MRLALLFALAWPLAAAAQPAFRLADPTLTVNGLAHGVLGAPLEANPFTGLVLDLPSVGSFAVSDRPFEGARVAGSFEGSGLFFSAEGHSVRLVSSGSMLEEGSERAAYVRFTPRAGAQAAGALAEVRLAPLSTSTPGLQTRAEASSPSDARLAAADAERARLVQELAQARAENRALQAEVARLSALGRIAPAGLLPSSPPAAQASAQASAPAAASAGTLTLPGFDFSRLQNAAEVLRWMQGVRPAGTGQAADVTVMFVTDTAGRVVETVIPYPTAGSRGELAEALVSTMRFVPPRVDGLPAVLRSQVVVRFPP